MTLARIYSAVTKDNDEVLRIHVERTERSGVYGYQFRATISHGGKLYTGSRTGGCGYEKISGAIALAASAMGLPYEQYALADSGRIDDFIKSITGPDITIREYS